MDNIPAEYKPPPDLNSAIAKLRYTVQAYKQLKLTTYFLLIDVLVFFSNCTQKQLQEVSILDGWGLVEDGMLSSKFADIYKSVWTQDSEVSTVTVLVRVRCKKV